MMYQIFIITEIFIECEDDCFIYAANPAISIQIIYTLSINLRISIQQNNDIKLQMKNKKNKNYKKTD